MSHGMQDSDKFYWARRAAGVTRNGQRRGYGLGRKER